MDKLSLKNEMFTSKQEKEIYRTLCTNIEFSGINNKVLAVTSIGEENRKSAVAFKLACALAKMERKVLYIDADICSSDRAERVTVSGAGVGLSHYLSGKAAMNECIYTTNVEGLFYLPAGVFTACAAQLLGSESFGKLLGEVRELYDYVIVDTAPLETMKEAEAAAKVCDGSIIVRESLRVSRKYMAACLAQLRQANPNIIGVVLNNAVIKGSKGSVVGTGANQAETEEA